MAYALMGILGILVRKAEAGSSCFSTVLLGILVATSGLVEGQKNASSPVPPKT